LTRVFKSIEGSVIGLFGDAYEYLLRMYALSAGKSGGEFLPRKKFPNY